MSKLILVRHGQSTYNKQGLWAGKTDVPLTDQGKVEAQAAGQEIKGIDIATVFVTNQQRTQETWTGIERVIKDQSFNLIIAPQFRERDYGDFTGQNKWEMKEKYGEEQWQRWRRGWNEPIPNGETLKDVYKRAVPYYQSEVLPKLREGQNVLVVASGNSLRALVKYLDGISDDDISQLEIPTGGILIYDIDYNGQVTAKEQRGATENKA